MNQIHFSYNWNKKLDCKAFTTFRRHNDRKYNVGEQHQIECKGKVPFIAECLGIRTMKLETVNEWMARIDTGYDLIEFKKILWKMYQSKPKALEGYFDFILLVKI